MAYEPKTKKNKASVASYIKNIADKGKQKDAKTLLSIFKEVTKEKPTMWGESIVGFGSYHYKGRTSEGDWPRTGFSARAQNMTVYIMLGFKEYGALLQKLGPHKTGSSCLYIKRLSDIHLPTLKALIKTSLRDMRKRYPN